jgi:hypothetical protein
MAFMFKLRLEDGTPADPPTLETAVPGLATGRHHPAGRQDASRARRSRLPRAA